MNIFIFNDNKEKSEALKYPFFGGFYFLIDSYHYQCIMQRLLKLFVFNLKFLLVHTT